MMRTAKPGADKWPPACAESTNSGSCRGVLPPLRHSAAWAGSAEPPYSGMPRNQFFRVVVLEPPGTARRSVSRLVLSLVGDQRSQP